MKKLLGIREGVSNIHSYDIFLNVLNIGFTYITDT